METVYKVKGKNIGLEFIFKYSLNGVLTAFEKNEGLTDKQRLWLYSAIFPETEALMKLWISDPGMRKKFEVFKAPADLSFENLWNLYDNKVKKVFAEKAYSKLNEAQRIKCFIHIPKYKERIVRTREAQAHLGTYLNQKYYEDEY